MTSTVHRIATRVSLWTLLSRVVGYGRDMAMAQLLGASAIVEAFQVAFSFPHLFRNLFGEGAINASLIPQYAKICETRGKLAAQQFFGDVVLVIGGLMLLFSLLSYIWMPDIINVLGWGFEEQTRRLTVDLARLCLPFLPCIILVALLGGILNHTGHFTLPAAIPIVLNVAMLGVLVAGLWGDWPFDIRRLAQAVVIAGFVQLGLCLLMAWRLRVLPHFAHRFRSKAMISFLALMLPGVMSGLFLQINFLTNRAFASTLSEGSIAWLFYAERLFSLPLALIGISLSIALLPLLSRAVSAGDHRRADTLAQQSLKAALFWSLPAALGMILCANWVVAVLFERGAFLANDTLNTARALQMLAIGLPAYVMIKVLQPLFFARHNTRTPMLIGLAVAGINIGLSLTLMPWLAHGGLALAAALSGWLQVMILYGKLGQYRPKIDNIGGFTAGIIAACVLMALVVWGLQWFIDYQSLVNDELTRIFYLVVVVTCAASVYTVAASRLTGYSWHAFRQNPEV